MDCPAPTPFNNQELELMSLFSDKEPYTFQDPCDDSVVRKCPFCTRCFKFLSVHITKNHYQENSEMLKHLERKIDQLMATENQVKSFVVYLQMKRESSFENSEKKKFQGLLGKLDQL